MSPTKAEPLAVKRGKRAGGRPTKYRREYCQTVIDLGKQGKSLVAMACALNVSVEVLEDWGAAHIEFLHALGEARRHSQCWWEDRGTEGMLAGPGSFNAAIWSRSMAARFPGTWREKRVRVDIPEVVDNSTLIRAQARVSAAIANGKLDIEGGTVLSKLLTDLGTSMERMDIEKRLLVLEEKLRVRT